MSPPWLTRTLYALGPVLLLALFGVFALARTSVGALTLVGVGLLLLSLLLLAKTTQNSMFHNLKVDFALSNPYVVVGLLFGGLLPYLFGAMGMTAVGRAGGAVVEEVREQFRNNPGIMAGTERPDYSRTRVLWRLYRKKSQPGYQARPQAAAALARIGEAAGEPLSPVAAWRISARAMS